MTRPLTYAAAGAILRASIELAAVAAFVWAVCALAAALEPLALQGAA